MATETARLSYKDILPTRFFEVAMSEAEQSEVDVRQAIIIAKKHIGDLFSTDQIRNIGLEEVRYDETDNSWNITIGFSRPWDTAQLPGGASVSYLFPDSTPRTYKVVNISAVDGKVNRVVNRSV